jgi:hypothetical protein
MRPSLQRPTKSPFSLILIWKQMCLITALLLGNKNNMCQYSHIIRILRQHATNNQSYILSTTPSITVYCKSQICVLAMHFLLSLLDWMCTVFMVSRFFPRYFLWLYIFSPQLVCRIRIRIHSASVPGSRRPEKELKGREKTANRFLLTLKVCFWKKNNFLRITWIWVRMDPRSFSILDPDPDQHSLKSWMRIRTRIKSMLIRNTGF